MIMKKLPFNIINVTSMCIVVSNAFYNTDRLYTIILPLHAIMSSLKIIIKRYNK